MAIEIKARNSQNQLRKAQSQLWHKQVGEAVSRDELIVDIETDKTVLEVVAAEDGVLAEVTKQEGDIVSSQELIGKIEAGAVASPSKKGTLRHHRRAADAQTQAALAANPAAKKLAEENNIDLASVTGTGKDGRILKEDVQNAIAATKATAPTKLGSSEIGCASLDR